MHASLAVWMVLTLVGLLGGCTAPDGVEPAGDGVDAGSVQEAQRPPQGARALRPWLAAGAYLGWTCEDVPHPARPGSAHSANRVCSNDALSASPSGTYPIGAASVKELYRGDVIDGYAVGLKVTGGADAASWYWFEVIGTSVVADGIGQSLCAGCHAGAPRDHVFTHVR